MVEEDESGRYRIINSIPRLKAHAKVALVRRWEDEQWKDYSFMATGNFNEATGRFYTDHVFFTTNKEFGRELDILFTYLQSRTQPILYVKYLLNICWCRSSI